MRLRDLQPHFVRRMFEHCEQGGGGAKCPIVHDGPREHEVHVRVDRIDEADGVFFLCPTCFVANRGPVGTHGVLCWRPRVPAGVDPGPGRWEFHGTGLDDLSLVAGSSSVLLRGGCNAHFFVEAGAIRMC